MCLPSGQSLILTLASTTSRSSSSECIRGLRVVSPVSPTSILTPLEPVVCLLFLFGLCCFVCWLLFLCLLSCSLLLLKDSRARNLFHTHLIGKASPLVQLCAKKNLSTHTGTPFPIHGSFTSSQKNLGRNSSQRFPELVQLRYHVKTTTNKSTFLGIDTAYLVLSDVLLSLFGHDEVWNCIGETWETSVSRFVSFWNLPRRMPMMLMLPLMQLSPNLTFVPSARLCVSSVI